MTWRMSSYGANAPVASPARADGASARPRTRAARTRRVAMARSHSTGRAARRGYRGSGARGVGAPPAGARRGPRGPQDVPKRQVQSPWQVPSGGQAAPGGSHSSPGSTLPLPQTATGIVVVVVSVGGGEDVVEDVSTVVVVVVSVVVELVVVLDVVVVVVDPPRRQLASQTPGDGGSHCSPVSTTPLPHTGWLKCVEWSVLTFRPTNWPTPTKLRPKRRLAF